MISGNTLINNITRNETIVCDWDGVIMDIDIYWMKKLVFKKKEYSKFFNFSKLKDENGNWNWEKVWYRDKYYFTDWLKKDNVTIPKDIIDEFTKLYIDDMMFYFYCPYLIMAKTLREVSREDFINKIIFLSSAPIGYNTDPRKIIMMNKFFFAESNPKFSLQIIEGSMSKAEYINKNIPDYTIFIDDRSDHIRDVIDHTDSRNKQFIFPVCGYNAELGNDEKYVAEISTRGIVLSTYKNEIYKYDDHINL